MSKQLNIRSDEAYAAAQRLAKRLGTTTTDAVVKALRRYEEETFKLIRPEELTPEQKTSYEHFRILALRARKEGGHGPADQGDFYDELGLPK